MVFDNQMASLSRTVAEGEDFYGQKREQTFITGDREITVQVNVHLGIEEEIESLSIPSGIITISSQDKTKDFSIMGDAGC